MSWMQLLAVSKSIGSVPDRPSPYKMRQKNLLPRFGRKVEREEFWRWPRRAAPAGGAETELGLFKAQPAVSTEVAEEQVALSEPAVGGDAKVEAPTERARGNWSWWFWRRRSRRVRRGDGEPFQGELVLDAVRVVRNDLTEDDLMVVPRYRREAEVEGGWKGLVGRWWRAWRG